MQVSKLTLADVNSAIRKHLRADRLQIVGVAKDAEALKAELTGAAATPIHYNSPKPQDVLDQDKIVEKWPLNLSTADVTVLPVASVFEN